MTKYLMLVGACAAAGLGLGLLVGGQVFAQTTPTVQQVRPSSGPATSIVVTVGAKALYADLGPGLAVDLPAGATRAVIRAVTVQHTHVVGMVLTPSWEDPHTCVTLPVAAQNAVFYLNGLRQSVGVDYAPEPGGKYCWITYYGNMTEGEHKGVFNADYVLP